MIYTNVTLEDKLTSEDVLRSMFEESSADDLYRSDLQHFLHKTKEDI